MHICLTTIHKIFYWQFSVSSHCIFCHFHLLREIYRFLMQNHACMYACVCIFLTCTFRTNKDISGQVACWLTRPVPARELGIGEFSIIENFFLQWIFRFVGRTKNTWLHTHTHTLMYIHIDIYKKKKTNNNTNNVL